jgi:mRNA interferase RelE/StbE
LAWTIELSASAEKTLAKLDRTTAKRIVHFLYERVAPLDDPRAIGASLHGDLHEFWKYRVGDYRLFATIEEHCVLIKVISIKHRSQAYQ